jgi:DNA ligase-associated metallophosphoesterase
VNVEIRGETFLLTSQKALVWPCKRLLAIADLHLGKAETFQKAGLWLPSDAQRDDVASLRALVARHDIRRVIFLGDLVHSLAGVTCAVERLFADWLDQFSGEAAVTIGNHDRPLLRDWPAAWKKATPIDRAEFGEFTFQHVLAAPPGRRFMWGGHGHPMVVLRGGSDRLRVPSFVIEPDSGMLPAFSSLAGGANVARAKGRMRYAVGSEGVFAVD